VGGCADGGATKGAYAAIIIGPPLLSLRHPAHKT